jgi:hypothetical protein
LFIHFELHGELQARLTRQTRPKHRPSESIQLQLEGEVLGGGLQFARRIIVEHDQFVDLEDGLEFGDFVQVD